MWPLTSWSHLAFFVVVILLCWRLSEKDSQFIDITINSELHYLFCVVYSEISKQVPFRQGFHLLACIAYILLPDAAWC